MENEAEHTLCSTTNFSPTGLTNDQFEKSSPERNNNVSDNYCKHPSTSSKDLDNVVGAGNFSDDCTRCPEPFCHVKLESLIKLKDSTKQLLRLLEEIQNKTHTNNMIPDETPRLSNAMTPLLQNNENSNVFDTVALRKLEKHAKHLDAIFIEDEHNCSVYKKLTRKCHCLNRPDYNDFVIHFNEDSKYTTSNRGEIIKNGRILKKFLYMGSKYTTNALMFLNEGMMESPHRERIEMTQACAHADICNVFDDHSIVITCISWPCKNKYYGDYVTQGLAASFIHNLAKLEEGRRYLNYSSKITNDIKKVLRKKSTVIEINTLDSLNATLNLLKPVFAKNVAINYLNRSVYEGVGKRTINDLVKNRHHMTHEEVLMHLDLLNNYSECETGRTELISLLPLLLIIFKSLLIEYDNSEINISMTNILNNIVSKNMIKDKDANSSKTLVFADTSTEAVTMKNEVCQIPPKKCNAKKINKNKMGLGLSPNKFQQPSKQKVSGKEGSTVVNRSKKFTSDRLKKSIIFVPIEQ